MQVLGGPIQPQEQVRYYIILLLWYYNDVRGLYKKKTKKLQMHWKLRLLQSLRILRQLL